MYYFGTEIKEGSAYSTHEIDDKVIYFNRKNLKGIDHLKETGVK